MKILLTGFGAFGGMDSNPTESLIEDIKSKTFKGAELFSILLPVQYDKSVEVLIKQVERIQPDIIISCGLYRSRSSISFERIAINVKDVMPEDPLPDRDGKMPIDEPINPNGPDGLFSNLPIRTITDKLVENQIPAYVSNTAGTFICNNTLYGILDYIRMNDLNCQAGFMHFPYTTEMVLNEPFSPSLEYSTMLKALTITIETILESMK